MTPQGGCGAGSWIRKSQTPAMSLGALPAENSREKVGKSGLGDSIPGMGTGNAGGAPKTGQTAKLQTGQTGEFQTGQTGIFQIGQTGIFLTGQTGEFPPRGWIHPGPEGGAGRGAGSPGRAGIPSGMLRPFQPWGGTHRRQERSLGIPRAPGMLENRSRRNSSQEKTLWMQSSTLILIHLLLILMDSLTIPDRNSSQEKPCSGLRAPSSRDAFPIPSRIFFPGKMQLFPPPPPSPRIFSFRASFEPSRRAANPGLIPGFPRIPRFPN